MPSSAPSVARPSSSDQSHLIEILVGALIGGCIGVIFLVIGVRMVLLLSKKRNAGRHYGRELKSVTAADKALKRSLSEKSTRASEVNGSSSPASSMLAVRLKTGSSQRSSASESNSAERSDSPSTQAARGHANVPTSPLLVVYANAPSAASSFSVGMNQAPALPVNYANFPLGTDQSTATTAPAAKLTATTSTTPAGVIYANQPGAPIFVSSGGGSAAASPHPVVYANAPSPFSTPPDGVGGP